MTAAVTPAEHRAGERRIAAAAASAALAVWGELDPTQLLAGWTRSLPVVLASLIAAQSAAVVAATAYVSGHSSSPQVMLNPAAFAGLSSDGRDLTSLLLQPALAVLGMLVRDLPASRALASGAAGLDMIVRTQVADASRTATGVAIAASPDIRGHERFVGGGACSRCIVLAGRLYHWSSGFARHPRCDCTMRPVTAEQWRNANVDNHPRALFERMTPTRQDATFGTAGAQAIRDGADPSQVVNARRGMAPASVGGREIAATREGISRRGLAGTRLAERFTGTQVVSQWNRTTPLGDEQRVRLRGTTAPRLMPEQIYAVADDRDHAMRLLRLHGYLL